MTLPKGFIEFGSRRLAVSEIESYCDDAFDSRICVHLRTRSGTVYRAHQITVNDVDERIIAAQEESK